MLKHHPAVGAEMVAALGETELTSIVRHHHERLDGGGYPDGLAGERIPLGARIVAVADTFDAVTSPRAYRPAMAHRQALALLDAEAGTQLTPTRAGIPPVLLRLPPGRSLGRGIEPAAPAAPRPRRASRAGRRRK